MLKAPTYPTPDIHAVLSIQTVKFCARLLYALFEDLTRCFCFFLPDFLSVKIFEK